MIILITILFEMFVFYVLNSTSNDFLANCFIILNIIIYFFEIILNKKINRIQKTLLIFGVVIRNILLIIDCYITYLPNSGFDSIGYYNSIKRIGENIDLLTENVYGGIFSKIFGIVCYIVGEQKIFIQSLNILLSYFTCLLCMYIINDFKIKEDSKKIINILIVFFPQTLVFSSIMMREMVITFLVTLSLYYCLKWIRNRKLLYEIFTLICIVFAALFHAGVIFLIVGYMLLFLLYNHDKQKIEIHFLKIALMVLCIVIGMYIYINYADILFPKIADSSFENMSETMTNTRGGSAYLTGVSIDSFVSLVIFMIPKTIYFMFSPMPWDWRGLMDIFSFMLDSLIYLCLIIGIIKNYKKIPKNKRIILLILLIGALITMVVFGIGTMTAGTAIRHRHKLFYYILMMYALSIFYKNKKYVNLIE